MANPYHFPSPAHEMTPATRHFAIVPSDTAKLPDQPKAIFCAAGGTIVIEDEAGNALSYAMVAGDILPFRAPKVRATGTSGMFYGWL